MTNKSTAFVLSMLSAMATGLPKVKQSTVKLSDRAKNSYIKSLKNRKKKTK